MPTVDLTMASNRARKKMIAVFPESQEIIFTGYFAYNNLNAKFRVPHKAEPLVTLKTVVFAGV